MKPVIGFSHYGHLGQHYMMAAKVKGFKVSNEIKECDIVFVSPDRPGQAPPEQAVETVLAQLNKDAVLVVLCQVEPGFTRRIKWPKERLYYQVETLRMKDAAERALNPDRIIIGIDYAIKVWDRRLREYIEEFCNHHIFMSYEEAELAKIAINIYLAAQVCVTDTLANVAKKIGANWQYIIPALQTDKRIGCEAYLKPGGYCGEHLERDLKQINKYDINTSVTEALLEYSNESESIIKRYN